MNITIIGSGYVGLVTGACLSYMGNKVICLDIDKQKVKDLDSGIIPIFEPGLEKIIRHSVKNSYLAFSSNIEDSIISADIIFIAVGTPMNKDGSANLSYIYAASKSIGQYINGYKIIITKSTIPVGSTSEVKSIIKSWLDYFIWNNIIWMLLFLIINQSIKL